MHCTPVENLRRCVYGSPPWVIFTMSLILMAIGVMILALRLGSIQEDNDMHSSVSACFSLTSKPKVIPAPALENGRHRITTKSGYLTLSSEMFKKLNGTVALDQSGYQLYTTVHNGQLGLKPMLENATVFIAIMLENYAPVCLDIGCQKLLMRCCFSAYNADVGDNSEEHSFCRNAAFNGSLSEPVTSVLVNVLDITDPNVGLSYPNCGNDSTIILRRGDGSELVQLPMEHETVLARLHLLYTSYFLFFIVLMLVFYAMCVNRNSCFRWSEKVSDGRIAYQKLVRR